MTERRAVANGEYCVERRVHCIDSTLEASETWYDGSVHDAANMQGFVEVAHLVEVLQEVEDTALNLIF